jgi:sortase A
MKKINNIITVILILILLVGVSLLLYPTISNYWNSFHQSRAIASYTEAVQSLDKETYKAIKEAAIEYNKSLLNRSNNFVLTDEQREEYESMLDIAGNGVMGYIQIPEIQVELPIYHGTDDAVLQIAIGHLDWTSLPIGGEGTHCVLSGHRGLKSAVLFTDLDKLVEGDIFTLTVLDEVLTYEIDQIRIVEPNEVNDLVIEEGKDYCTLMTCTPLGINSHRMLLRGRRIDNIEATTLAKVTADAEQIEPLLVAPIIAIPILLILLIGLLRPQKPLNKKRGESSETDK